MLEGRPVTFDVVTPASRNWTTEEQPGSGGVRSLQIVLLVLAMLIVGGAVFLAVRNRQKGRGDVKGAFRVAGVIFFGRLLFWLFSGHHVASFAGEFYMIGTSLGFALLLALASWIFYMAVEPYARKLWPQSLVGWSRIIGGRLRDPVVGRELLVGAAFGAILAVTIPLRTMAPEWFGAAAPAPLNWGMAALEGGRYALGLLFLIPVVALTNPLMNYLLLLLLRIVLRRQVFAAIGFSLISILGDTAQLAGSGPTASFSAPIVGLGIFFGIVDAAIVIVLMTRYGLLATTGCFVVIQTFNLFPLTLDPSLPYFGVSLLGLAAPLAMTVFAFIQASSGRSLFQDRLLEGEAT